MLKAKLVEVPVECSQAQHLKIFYERHFSSYHGVPRPYFSLRGSLAGSTTRRQDSGMSVHICWYNVLYSRWTKESGVAPPRQLETTYDKSNVR
ncbi:hypothetical protein BGAL_0500g00040 [Botrytis galanthina]|uniref:Uncharacterized protein n=1 Tax=Botrytis galanthina TaxID=278940 RepID=A0A4S8QKE8_9HELO|nr:hypothetical protein BGAL_0500g00040 [Botrytis galanthina]